MVISSIYCAAATFFQRKLRTYKQVKLGCILATFFFFQFLIYFADKLPDM